MRASSELVGEAAVHTAIQFALPAEHRAAGFAFYLVTSQGIMALGSLLWGAVGARIGIAEAFVFAGILFIAVGIVTRCVPLPWRPA